MKNEINKNKTNQIPMWSKLKRRLRKTDHFLQKVQIMAEEKISDLKPSIVQQLQIMPVKKVPRMIYYLSGISAGLCLIMVSYYIYIKTWKVHQTNFKKVSEKIILAAIEIVSIVNQTSSEAEKTNQIKTIIASVKDELSRPWDKTSSDESMTSSDIEHLKTLSQNHLASQLVHVETSIQDQSNAIMAASNQIQETLNSESPDVPSRIVQIVQDLQEQISHTAPQLSQEDMIQKVIELIQGDDENSRQLRIKLRDIIHDKDQITVSRPELSDDEHRKIEMILYQLQNLPVKEYPQLQALQSQAQALYSAEKLNDLRGSEIDHVWNVITNHIQPIRDQLNQKLQSYADLIKKTPDLNTEQERLGNNPSLAELVNFKDNVIEKSVEGGAIRIFVRINRSSTIEDGKKQSIEMASEMQVFNDNSVKVIKKRRSQATNDIQNEETLYSGFEKVFENATQEDVYNSVEKTLNCAINLTEENAKICSSRDCYIFAYGQTGAGKTYTMVGNTASGDPSQRGIALRAIEKLIQTCEDCQIHVSFVEIYMYYYYSFKPQNNETVVKQKVTDKEIQNKRMYNHETLVTNLENFEKLLRIVNESRFTRHNGRNPESSRGHLIIRVRAKKGQLESNMYFIDLAGSETCKEDEVKSILIGELLKTQQRRLNNDLDIINGNIKKTFKITGNDAAITIARIVSQEGIFINKSLTELITNGTNRNWESGVIGKALGITKNTIPRISVFFNVRTTDVDTSANTLQKAIVLANPIEPQTKNKKPRKVRN